jgi:beta-glucosidase
MKLNKQIAILMSIVVLASHAMAQTATIKLNPSIESKIDALLKQMTLQEKVGQMAQVAIDVVGKVDNAKQTYTIDADKLNDVVVNYKVGSILNTPPGVLLTPEQWNQVIADIQGAAQKTKLKIPILYGLDDIHGIGNLCTMVQ